MIFKFYNKSLTSATHETISSGEFERSFVLSVFKTDLHVQSLWKFSSLKLKFSLINKYVNILRLFVDLNIDLVWWLQNNQWSMLYESESLNYRMKDFSRTIRFGETQPFKLLHRENGTSFSFQRILQYYFSVRLFSLSTFRGAPPGNNRGICCFAGIFAVTSSMTQTILSLINE